MTSFFRAVLVAGGGPAGLAGGTGGAVVAAAAWADLADAVADGSVRAAVHAEYALADVPAAHAALAEDRHVGKLVIVP